MDKSRKRSLVLLALFSIGVGTAVSRAQDDEDAPILEYRQKVMVGQRASMASIGDILKYKLYDSNHIRIHAKNISEYARLIPDAFEKKIAEGLTDAQPEVWQSWDDFVAKAKTLSDASAALSTAAEGGDMRAVMPHVKAVGDACRGCHNTYRKPEEERFERK